jgi:hypothetical protein
MRDREERQSDRRAHAAALAVLGRCVRRRALPDWMWRSFDVFAGDFEDLRQALVA